MRVVGLVSGGKDSIYNLMRCKQEGHEIVALANLYPRDTDELDSFMYQSVGHSVVPLIADALELPLFREEISGTAVDQSLQFSAASLTPEDEVSSLENLLARIQKEVQFEGVSVGAIFSDYQTNRVNIVCERLQLTPLALLWHRNQVELLREMIAAGVDAILCKVAAFGLSPEKFVGKSLASAAPELERLSELQDLHACGEGGEFETVVLDCPLFPRRRLLLDGFRLVTDNSGAGHMTEVRAHLVDKSEL